MHRRLHCVSCRPPDLPALGSIVRALGLVGLVAGYRWDAERGAALLVEQMDRDCTRIVFPGELLPLDGGRDEPERRSARA